VSRAVGAAGARGGSTAAWLSLLACLGLAPSCATSAQEPIELELRAAGVAVESVTLPGGSLVRPTRAALVVGPVYLCSGASAGELCDTARAESLDATAIDALSAEGTSLAPLVGASGTARSYMYDHGYSSLLTEREPFAWPATGELEGASLWLEGAATLVYAPGVVSREIPFRLLVTVETSEELERGQPVVRKSASEPFEHELSSSSERLTLRFDAAPWFGALVPSELGEDASCAGATTGIRCAKDVALDCATGGRTDCAADSLFCAPEAGCVPRVELSEESASYRAVLGALVAGERPRFEWD
jgi:hypothetical protein